MLVFGGKHEYDGCWSPMTYFPSYMLRRSPQKSNDDVQYSELLFYWTVPDVCFLIQFQNVHRWSFMGRIHGTTRLQRYWQFIATFPGGSLQKGAEEKDIHLPSSKLTWQWKFTFSNRKYIFKWWIFHSYVGLPEGISGKSRLREIS